jgi:hypothetical protein
VTVGRQRLAVPGLDHLGGGVVERTGELPGIVQERPSGANVWPRAVLPVASAPAPDSAGDIYTVAGGGSSLQDGVPATAAAVFPIAVMVDHAGNIVIAGAGALRVVAVKAGTFYGQAMTAGDIYTVAGGGSSTQDGVPATSAAITPFGVAVDAAGNLLLADPAASRVRVVAVATGRFYGQVMTAGGIYTAAGGGTSPRDGVRARTAALAPYGVAVDHAGNLVVADFAGRVRVVAVATGRF